MSRLSVQPPQAEPRAAMPLSRLVAFVLAQLGVHAVMAGLRMSVPLQALRDGHSSLLVGLLLALFSAIPVLFSLRVGRYIDSAGYHRPVQWAAVMALAAALVAAAAALVGHTELRLVGLGLAALLGAVPPTWACWPHSARRDNRPLMPPIESGCSAFSAWARPWPTSSVR